MLIAGRGGLVIRVFRVKKRFLLLMVIVLMTGFYISRVVAGGIEDRRVSAMSWSVAGRIIAVDPGHGGIDPGSKGNSGVEEEEITLAVSEKLKETLTGAGAVVLMTRESDIDLSDPDGSRLITRKRQDLSRRLALAEKNGADIYLSVHVNCFKSGPREHGAQVFYQPGSEEGKALAESIQAEMIRVLGNTNRKAKAVDYYTTRNSKMPAAIVEVGFISNPKEEKMMLDAEYQRKLAYAMYCGLVKYFAGNATATDNPIDRDGALETFMKNEGQVFDAP